MNFMKTKHWREHRPFRMKYACLHPPDEDDIVNFEQCSLSVIS